MKIVPCLKHMTFVLFGITKGPIHLALLLALDYTVYIYIYIYIYI